MKTLDDALKAATDAFAKLSPEQQEAMFREQQKSWARGLVGDGPIRRIADHLDPPATEEPRGCPLPGVCACSTATLHIDRVKAEARREALEEAIHAIPAGWDAGNGSGTRVITPDEAIAAIRALIEKETEV